MAVAAPVLVPLAWEFAAVLVPWIESAGGTIWMNLFHDHKRAAAVEQKTIFQFDPDRLPSGAMCKLKRLTMNVTGTDDGTATFSSPGCINKQGSGFDNVYGLVSGHVVSLPANHW
jgi:hypothetical protein